MYRTYKFRLYPSRIQAERLTEHLNTHRHLYNTALSHRMLAWEYKLSLSFRDQCKWLTKERDSNKWFSRINAQSSQHTLKRLEDAFKRFFKWATKGGAVFHHPKFKAFGFFKSFTFPAYGNGVKIRANGKLYILGVGEVRLKQHRPMFGRIKTVSIKWEGGKWHALFSCDIEDVAIPMKAGDEIGIDMGIENFLTTSDGEVVENPRILQHGLPALRRIGRKVARKKKGGRNRRKAVKALARLHAKVANRRREFRYQVARKLTSRAGMIAVERLSVKWMLANPRIARAVHDAGWMGFLSILRQKADEAGVRVVEVCARNTSQRCSGCKADTPKKWSVRVHHCPHCGLKLHRDLNAARNILALARTEPTGANGGLSTTVA